MPSEIDWENEVDFNEENENEVDENSEELDEEDTEEYEEEPEEDEDSEEYEEESEEDEDTEENTLESTNRAALFIDGTLADYRYAEKIEKAALKQGDLKFAKVYRIRNEKSWNKTVESFTVECESIAVDAANRNEQIRKSILCNCVDIDIVCICTNANFFEDVIAELKALGKKVVLISTWAVSSNKLGKASDVVVQLRTAPVQNSKKKTQAAAVKPKNPTVVLYIDGNGISPKRAKQIVEFAKTKGNLKCAYVFTVKGHEKAKKWGKKAEKFGIKNICLEKGTKKSDISKFISKDMASEINESDYLCIAANNAVFGKKAKAIHKSGKKVVIITERELLPELFKICDEIYDLNSEQLYPNYEYAYKKCAINAALFIDGENIPHDYANLILSKAWEQGNLNLNIGGVYCREDDPGTKPWKLKAEVFKLKANKVKGKAAKNKVDNAIIADALKCMKENDNIKTFCIASHDKDYAKTVVKLRKAGKRVCVIGKIDMVSDEMRFICDEFIPI